MDSSQPLCENGQNADDEELDPPEEAALLFVCVRVRMRVRQ